MSGLKFNKSYQIKTGLVQEQSDTLKTQVYNVYTHTNCDKWGKILTSSEHIDFQIKVENVLFSPINRDVPLDKKEPTP